MSDSVTKTSNCVFNDTGISREVTSVRPWWGHVKHLDKERPRRIKKNKNCGLESKTSR